LIGIQNQHACAKIDLQFAAEIQVPQEGQGKKRGAFLLLITVLRFALPIQNASSPPPGTYVSRTHSYIHAVIEGETTAAVAHAKRRVEMVAWTNRFKEEPTHFISIPLNFSPIMEKFNQFKTEVLASCGKVNMA
jgi:hypothetical protein